MWHIRYFDTISEAQDFVLKVEKEHGLANRPKYADGKWSVGYTYD